MSGGNQSVTGATPYAADTSVTEWPTVNAVTIHTSRFSSRRNGTTRHSKNNR
ncbi:hypothetical protein D3C83_154590 [compost metagenome]